jgi:hypothetical protein
MLSTDQKITVLIKAGISVPAFPARRLTVQEDASIPSDEREADAQQRAKEWKTTIDALYREYAARSHGSRRVGIGCDGRSDKSLEAGPPRATGLQMS